MTESELRTESKYYNQATKLKLLIHEEHNSAYNHHTIVEALKSGRARDIGDEPKADGMPMLVIGSGPSLNDILPRIHEWKGGIICTTSHALTLIHWGIEPTYIMAMDPFCTWEEIDGIDWSKTRTKLITDPGCWPSLLQTWPNEMLLYRKNIAEPGHFYTGEQKRMYTRRVVMNNDIRQAVFEPLIPSEFTLFSCSPPMQSFMSKMLGYGTQFMVGVDFAYSNDMGRFTSWDIEDGEWVEHVIPIHEGDWAIDDKSVITDNGLKTHQVHLYYKKTTFCALRLSWQSAYWLGLGAVTEYPTTTIDKLMRSQGRGYKKLSRQFIRKATDEYLAKVGAYVIETNQGRMMFLETENPGVEIPAAIARLQRSYRCNNCGAVAVSPDDTDHSGEQCKECHKRDAMYKASPGIDLDKNMRRIRRLIAGQIVRAPSHFNILDANIQQV